MSIYSKLNSLLTAANNKTGESDTTLTDAVQTLIDGYGQGGGGGQQIGITNTLIPNILNMFYELEHGTAKTGEFTPATALPNTSTALFDTELQTVHGLFIADESQDTLNTGSAPENILFAYVADPSYDDTGASDYTGYTYAVHRRNIQLNHQTANVATRFLNRGAWTVTNGIFSYTAPYNKNDSYCAFHSGHTYRWVAW